MNETTETIATPILKIAGVWAAVGITSWSEAASFAAFCFSCLLIIEFVWKKIKPFIRGDKGARDGE